MNRVATTVTTLGASGALVLGLAMPAAAATKTRADKRGDAPASADITKVAYHHTKKGVSATAKVRKLANKGQFVLAIANRSKSLQYGVEATRKGHTTKQRFLVNRKGKISRIRCSGMRTVWSTKHSAVRISFPRRCYKPLGTKVLLKIASTKPFLKTVDGAPTVRF